MYGRDVVSFGRWKNKTVGLHNYIIITFFQTITNLWKFEKLLLVYSPKAYQLSFLHFCRPSHLSYNFYYFRDQLFKLLSRYFSISIDIQCLHHVVNFGEGRFLNVEGR